MDACSGKYNFLGPKQLNFKTMTALLEYYKYEVTIVSLAFFYSDTYLHRTNPITWEGQEMLLLPVAMEDERDVYGGLYSGDSEEEDSDGSIL